MIFSSRKILFPLAGIAMGCVVSASFVEGGFKLVDIFQQHKKGQMVGRISRVSDIPGVRYEMIPNITTITPGFKKTVRINNLGFRGPDLTVEKPPGTFRIAVLGDSIAFGRTLDEEDVFPHKLEKRMNRSGKYRMKVEVINATLSGRDTWEERALLKHRVLEMQPDLVILEICLNDHIRFSPPEKGDKIGVFGDLAWWQYSSFLSFLDRKIEGFRQYHVKVLKKTGLYRPSGHAFLRDFYIDPRNMLKIEDDWEEWRRVLLDIRNLSRDNEAEILFLLFPLRYHIKEGLTETSPLLTEFAREQDIPLIDLAKSFSKNGVSLYSDHIHPKAMGHRIVVNKLEKHIASRFPSLLTAVDSRAVP